MKLIRLFNWRFATEAMTIGIVSEKKINAIAMQQPNHREDNLAFFTKNLTKNNVFFRSRKF